MENTTAAQIKEDLQSYDPDHIITLDQLLNEISVIPPGQWENDEGPEGWYAVAGTAGIVAYFGNHSDAYSFKLDLINQVLNH